MPTPTDPTSPPVALRVAAVICLVEAVASAAMGVADAVEVRASRAVVGVGAALLMVAYAAALVGIARGLWRTRRWSRGPAVATHLIHLPVAYSFLGGPTVAIGIAIGVLALVVLGCVLSPAATSVLVGDTD